MSKATMLFFSFIVCGLLLSVLGKPSSSAANLPAESNDHKGLTPFFLEDPNDNTCLGPEGFTICDEHALWIWTRRNGKTSNSLVSFLNPHKACLQRQPTFFGLLNGDKLITGSCSKSSAKGWEFEFLDKQTVQLTNKGACLVRGKKGHKSSISLGNCKKSPILRLVYSPTSVHENGFYLKAADGKCFDGNKFRTCSNANSANLLWGVGVRYGWGGEAYQYLFSYSKKDRTCLIYQGKKVIRGDCGQSKALGWGLNNGQLTNQDGKQCLIRNEDDTASLMPCTEGHEFVKLEVPAIYTMEELRELISNPVSAF
jgi:hypothetical protein